MNCLTYYHDLAAKKNFTQSCSNEITIKFAIKLNELFYLDKKKKYKHKKEYSNLVQFFKILFCGS